MAKTKVTYVDESGARRTGLSDTPPATDGSAADWEALQAEYQGLYARRVAENEAAAQAARARAAQEESARAGELNGAYRSTNRQLYRDYMRSQKNLGQQLSAGGYTGGLSESSRLALDTGYQANVGESERERLARLDAVRADAAQARSTAESELTQANRQAQDSYYADYAAALARRQTQENHEDEQRRRQEAELYAKSVEQATTLARYGDFSGYLKLGYSEEQVGIMRSIWAAQNPKLAWI